MQNQAVLPLSDSAYTGRANGWTQNGRQNHSLCGKSPPGSQKEAERDFKLWLNLSLLIKEVASLLEALEAMHMAAGSGAGAGACSAALLIYGSLKQAAEAAAAGVPGTSTLIEELNTRFERAVQVRRSQEGQTVAGKSTESTSS